MNCSLEGILYQTGESIIIAQCDFLVNSELDMATTMADLCRIHRQLIYNICTDSRSFTRIFNKTRVNYKLFFILTKKLESMSFHIKIWHLVELFLIFWHCFLFVYLQIKKALNKRLFYIYHTVLLIQKARRNLNISLCF